MKWNWGHSLTLIFIAFATHIGYLVYKCTQEKIDLVSADYYNEELRYQDKIDGIRNASIISPLQIKQSDAIITIQLPNELRGKTYTGQAWFYCPSKAANDRKLSLRFDATGLVTIEKAQLANASYTAKISWQKDSTQYYYEQTLAINR